MPWHALLPLLAAWAAEAQDAPAPEIAAALGALGADDECRVGAAEQCGLSAMQLHRQKAKEVELAGPYEQCGGETWEGSTECTQGYLCFNVTEYYSQCKPAADVKAPTWKKYAGSAILNAKSEAPALAFYLYRAVDSGSYPLPNADASSIGAMLWYLHVEQTSPIPSSRWQSRIDRVQRYKVQTRATQPLFAAGMNFGVLQAFTKGRCVGPGDCDKLFGRYGYFVGCSNLSHPTIPVHYKGAFYSLPGTCTANSADDKTLECRRDQPGGSCEDVPTGTGTCTWSYTEAGEVSLAELEGFTNDRKMEDFNRTFWQGLDNPEANAARVQKLDALFKEKRPEMPSDEELPAPPCDFNKGDFL